jgi:hypothetical protein
MTRSLAVASVFWFASTALAQLHALPGIPVVDPPVPHPSLAAQLRSANEEAPRPGGGGGGGGPSGPATAAPAPQPDTVGAKVSGKELKKAVARVRTLQWHRSLVDAKAMAAATGKPILLLQALGDLEGFA